MFAVPVKSVQLRCKLKGELSCYFYDNPGHFFKYNLHDTRPYIHWYQQTV